MVVVLVLSLLINIVYIGLTIVAYLQYRKINKMRKNAFDSIFEGIESLDLKEEEVDNYEEFKAFFNN